jgi:HEAT repeat protein
MANGDDAPLAELGQAVPLLALALKDGNASIRAGAAHALSGIGAGARPAVAELIEAFRGEYKDPNIRDQIRSNAGSALEKIGEPAVPGLVDVLQDKNQFLRFEASNRLTRIGEPAVPALLGALKSTSKDQRLMAAYTLGQLGAQKAVPALTRLSQDASEDGSVRQAAAEALKKIRNQ